MTARYTPAGPEDHPRLLALLQLYAYDFSEHLPLHVADDGRFHLPSVSAKLIDPGSHAFVIRVDDRLARFALVQSHSYLTGAAGVFDMAELFVMRRYRRCGVGEQVATGLFAAFRGPWKCASASSIRPPRHSGVASSVATPEAISRIGCSMTSAGAASPALPQRSSRPAV